MFFRRFWKALNMKETEYFCCFCGQKIGHSLPDPCFLDLRTNRDQDEVQELACHADCLDKVAYPEIQLLTQI